MNNIQIYENGYKKEHYQRIEINVKFLYKDLIKDIAKDSEKRD